jgi:thioesterase domain-containing protein
LIRALGPGPSSYGFRLAPDMLDHLSTLTIEETARRFAIDLIASGIARPLHLVGFSFAGYMAVETAVQLTRLGHPPDRLWILDMVAHPKISWRSLLRYARTRVSRRRADVLVHPAFIWIDLSRHPESYRPILRRFYALFSRYRPGRWSGATTLVVADGSCRNGAPQDLGWGSYISCLDRITVPGDHLSMIHDDRNAAVLASRFHDQFRKDIVSVEMTANAVAKGQGA